MKYKLNTTKTETSGGMWAALRALLPYMKGENRNLILVAGAILVNTGANLVAPILIGHTIDTYIVKHNFHGVVVFSGLLLGIFVLGFIASYIQTQTMGGVARRILFNLRNALFTKLQELPVAFFNQNKAGDLISRINSDTDKLNQFFSQALMQFLGSFFLVLGTGIFVLSLNYRLGGAALVPALLILLVTQLLSPWVKQKNLASLQSTGRLSSEIQENLSNFKVIVAFNRLDYFRDTFTESNQANYLASIKAGIANTVFTPLYTAASTLAQLIVIVLGIYMIQTGSITIGVMIGFLLYVNNFYSPLRQLASIWSTLQQTLAAFDRISEVLILTSDLPIIAAEVTKTQHSLLEFKNVSFTYPEGKQILHNVDLQLEEGKTYALVGPTGGGKTTTASLLARLYDPTEGEVLLMGKDIRSYTPEERASTIGFILQEPFLFSGTIRDNIVYAHPEYSSFSNEQLLALLNDTGLAHLLERFDQGLDTKLTASGEGVSLGQKQLIAFIRAVLRRPKLLILDEATANIDTVTEQLLEDVLRSLPAATTKVIIAHRLNTIENADEIFFVNSGEITKAGSMESAVDLLLHNKRAS